MTERSMAINSSEQVPGQQTDESSAAEQSSEHNDDEHPKRGLGKDASAD